MRRASPSSATRVTRFTMLLVGIVAIGSAIGHAVAGGSGLLSGVILTVVGTALVILFAALM
jgi:hypothetical protein